jgi:acetyl-CoA C-acetyltransferase
VVEEVIFSQGYPNSEAPCIGRWAALAAGLPFGTAGIQIDRRCGGGLQAVATAVMMVETSAADVVIAGGVESMSNIEYYSTAMRAGARAGTIPFYDRLDRGRERTQPAKRFGRISGMIETAENVAREHAITRDGRCFCRGKASIERRRLKPLVGLSMRSFRSKFPPKMDGLGCSPKTRPFGAMQP